MNIRSLAGPMPPTAVSRRSSRHSVYSSPSSKLETTLIVLLVLLYSGISNYFPTLSRFGGLTPLDLLIGMSVLGIVLRNGRALKRVTIVAPFVVWVIIYYAYGTIIAPDTESIISNVVNRLIILPLIAIAVSLALVHRGSVVRFCTYLQLGVIVGSVFTALQSWNLNFVASTSLFVLKSLSSDDIGVAQIRSTGLMFNANEAGFFFTIGLMVSIWAKGPIAWLGRISAIVGIFHTASRTAGILALAVIIFYVAYTTSRSRMKSSYKVWLLLILAAFLTIVMVIFGAGRASLSHPDDDDRDKIFLSKVEHLADLSQRQESMTRQDLTAQWIHKALSGPWYGSGVYSFQADPADAYRRYGAHNIFVTVWGEIGLIGFALFLLLIGYGLSLTFRARLESKDRFVLRLIWFAWLSIGLTWHNQIDNKVAAIVWGLLFVLPRALATPQFGADSSSVK